MPVTKDTPISNFNEFANKTLLLGSDGSTRISNSNPIPVSNLTEAQQLEVVKQAIQEVINRLDVLPSVRGIAADLRVTLLSGTVTTVSTVSTVSNITSIGGYNANNVPTGIQNAIAVQSNINNVSNI